MKDTPIISTGQVLEIVTDALKSKIGERLSAYSSPLNGIVDAVVKEQGDQLTDICRKALAHVVSSKEFANNVQNEFTHKVAKTLVGKLEGTVEKAVETLRQDPRLRAEMILAIEKLIKGND